ncbi:MAG: plastocyanin/azurin family copper-binding protein [Verrucomicrobia bacterium]|nr:plastocyanin/azurin family copper-binding protein [Verrucomicrobiota bacterium]
MRFRFHHSISKCLAAFVLISIPATQAQESNLATPSKHPYANPALGRESYQLSTETVNEARLYDFYQRQADYYMKHPDEMPEILPAYPGLDAGQHGHWGKHNQNNYGDGRWNEIEMGEVVTQVFRAEDLVVLKGISLRLGEQRELSACFDPMSLTYRAVWEDGFVQFDPFRWGTSRNAQLQGKPWFIVPEADMPAGSVYHGFHRYGKRVVFNYTINDIPISDEPWATSDTFFRRIDIKKATSTLQIPCPVGEGFEVQFPTTHRVSGAKWKNGHIHLTDTREDSFVILSITKTPAPRQTKPALDHLKMPRKLTRRWPETLKVPGTVANPGADTAYVVDTLNVPYDNPYQTVMQISGIDFLPNGDALVCTLPGDIWLVSGITEDLRQVTWQRFATGLNQPIGIHIDEDGIFVLDRGQIYRLHDTNNDGEADFYENYAHDFGGYNRSHSHTFGLHRTADGSFHFTQRENILRTGPDRVTTEQGWGVRNCMGIGGSDDYFWVAPQEGTWTPASAIIEVNQGEFYGLPDSNGRRGTIAAPLCFIPRGVDNSTGGMVEVTSNRWGPFQGSHIGLSYGSGIHYLILRDATGGRPQGAVVPLEGEFLAGSMRGAFHPKDGQLYVVGLDGWGDYSTKDGCFHRVRYTGNPVYKPKGFRVHSNGIRIDFTTKLDPNTRGDLGSFFAHGWNYEYANRYGSPEFSPNHPESLGHDPVSIRSVTLLGDGSSLFVEMPTMRPVMQLHIRMHLTSIEGKAFKTDLFASPMYPGPHFDATGLEPARVGKPTAIALRVAREEASTSDDHQSGTAETNERQLVVDAIGGLQYKQKLLVAKPGEALALTLNNTDVMPHNLVIVKQGSTRSVGEASFKMLNDPKAGEKSYVPELTEVLQFIPIVNPGKTHTLHFRAPETPGDYPYICTFPGHWMAMQGILRVQTSR